MCSTKKPGTDILIISRDSVDLYADKYHMEEIARVLVSPGVVRVSASPGSSIPGFARLGHALGSC